MQDETTLEDTLSLMNDLRKRCDWDAAQTHQSLRPYLVEEAHELDDAIQSGNDASLREELGDVLLQVLFHSVIAAERNAFTFQDVARGLIAKMQARHPHLYGDGAKVPWEHMKSTTRVSLADGLPLALPSLHRAHRLQDRAAGVGFDWPDLSGPAAKVDEELREVRTELANLGEAPPGTAPVGARQGRLEEELGDLLFAVVNLCRKAGVHASLALDRANAKFVRRWLAVERLAGERGIVVRQAGIDALDRLWDEVKKGEG
ncbi:MAG: nucleoside triphosphate pyrophosphohydrolase [Gemmatimonadaceae bacterium]